MKELSVIALLAFGLCFLYTAHQEHHHRLAIKGLTAQHHSQSRGAQLHLEEAAGPNAPMLDRGALSARAGAHPHQLAITAALPPAEDAAVTDETMLDRGIISAGAGARTRLLLRKLAAGKNVPSVVLGGSISMGHGTSGWPQRNDCAFGAVVHRWLAKVFPAASVRHHNGAVGATPSGYMSMCLSWHCPQDADLILLEYAVNDSPGRKNLEERRPFEQLLRRLLALPNRPEVLLVMTFHNTHDFDNASAEDDMALFALYCAPRTHHGTEPCSEELRHGLPWVSLRGLLFHATRGDAPKLALNTLFEDDHHPRDLGHQMIADMIIGHFRRAVAGLMLRSYNDASDDAAAAEALPPPLIKGNEASKAERCIFHDEFQAIVKHADGFQWLNEAAEGRPLKEGYVATEPGSQLRLVLNTSEAVVGTDPSKRADSHAIVAINYLRSYEHMGTAAVTCEDGCSCEPSVFEGHNEEHNSQHYMHRFNVSPAEHCEIVITVAGETKSGEHKVKVLGVVLLDEFTNALGFHDTMLVGAKGATGDLRFESSWTKNRRRK